MRRVGYTPLALIACFGALACNPAAEPAPAKTGDQAVAGKPDAKQPDAGKPDAGKPDAAKPDAKPAKHKHASELAPKPKPTEATRLKNHITLLLNEGRALTKKGDFAGGIEKYRQALDVDANDVAVLGELGWAAFKAGDLELAHRSTTQALKFVRAEPQRGMLLYNLGRIAEERGNFSDAVEHYEASLVARPDNATVTERLASARETQNAQAIAASAGGELEGPDRALASAALDPLGRDLADLAAVCKLVEEQRCEDYTMADSDVCRCLPNVLASPGADPSWGLIQLGEETTNMQVAWFPVVQTDKGWTVFSEVLYAYNPGAFGVFETATLGASTVEPLLGTGTQLVMKFDKSRVDRDMGLNEIETEDYSATVICARHETGAYCTKALLTAYRLAREVEFPEEEANIEPPIEHPGLPSEQGFTGSVAFVDGKLVVTWTDSKGDYTGQGDLWGALGWILPAGEHALAILLGLPS